MTILASDLQAAMRETVRGEDFLPTMRIVCYCRCSTVQNGHLTLGVVALAVQVLLKQEVA
jgi:hypothetical protein